ncbi:MAG: NAD(P)/FAD-dependent oxidoreductase [Sarcina sp.]
MRYIVIGASAAGISGAKRLRELDESAQIVLISKDEYIYSRCILHHYISGVRNIAQLDFSEDDYINKYNILWKKGIEVLSVNDESKKLRLSNGESLSYDKLLICSGASSFIPPIENLRTANNVFGLRNLDDAQSIKEIGAKVKNVAVLGAGLIGIDAVSGLMNSGVNLSLVEMGDRVLPIQLDKKAASEYEKRFEANGVNLKLSVKAQKVLVDENNNPTGILLDTEEVVPCEMIVVATGVRANTAFLEGSNVEYDKFGLIIDAKGKTNIEDIFGAGDITGRNPIWPTAVKEGIIAASNMLNIETEMTDFFGSKNTMNFVGLATLSLGLINLSQEQEKEYIVDIKTTDDSYKKIVHKDGKIYGALIQGDLEYTGILTELIRDNIDVSKVKKSLFEIDYSDFFKLKENLEYTYNDVE